MNAKKQQKMSTNLANIITQFDTLFNTISTFRGQLTLMQQQLKLIEKSSKKHIKQLERELNKRKPKGNRKPSGFAKPTKISERLCTFMDKPNGSELARTEVTQYLITYIKNNELQNKENKRIICPDNKLKILLGIDDTDELNYFNLQSYMNQHFIKANK